MGETAASHLVNAVAPLRDPPSPENTKRAAESVAAAVINIGSANLSRTLTDATKEVEKGAPPSVATPLSPTEAKPKQITFIGYATYYGSAGEKTAEGKPFNPNGMNAAMFQKVVTLESSAYVQLSSDPKKSIDVTVNDTGPFLRGSDKKPVYPLQPDPNIVIDLTPAAFAKLAPLSAGKIPVIVTVTVK